MFPMSRRLLCCLLLLASALPTAALAQTAAKDAKDALAVLLVPPVALGEVRAVFEKRIAKALQDQLQFSNRLHLLTDRDRAEAPAADRTKAVQVKSTPASRRIDEADQLRQEGTDLAAEGKHGPALARLKAAIAAYEASYLELVDYTKLADAYARAGLAAFQSGAGAGEAERLFEDGIALQPTLVIDRRKQPKDLLELFDTVHARLERQPKGTVVVQGETPGVEVFVDGVKRGLLPARAEGLLPGPHYVQVRGEGFQPWGQVVRVRGKDVAVKANPKAVKTAAPAAAAAELTLADLDACRAKGTFHAQSCKGPGTKLARQTGAAFLVFAAIKADKYGRLAVHPFVMEGATGATVALKPVELAADLSDLNAKAAAFEEDLDAALRPFAKARALTKPPSIYK